jgi:molecular chaperone DnaK (HSP70)
MARRQAAEIPDRTVGAAKSWLCHGRVDRRGEILPWNAPAEVAKISPVTASRRYLEHLIAAWEHAFPDGPVADQHVVLTVPASFDAAARDLTREAALAAGLPESLVLLEEPQAAVYAWVEKTGDRWRKSLKLDDVLLVCDVGGGTSDFTLVKVAEEGGELVLQRVAVGNHLLVGGDNMDLALAHASAEMFSKKKTSLDPWQSVSLWHACRTAKETLLTSDGPNTHTISVLGRGSKLVGGTVSIEMKRKQAADILVDGFFPRCSIDQRPTRRRVSGFQEIGLPFEQDTAITRHLAAFLQDHGQGPGNPVLPTHVLVNGGAFKAKALSDRLIEVLADWTGGQGPRWIEEERDLDNSVARGAAFYGWTKERGGVRIRGGTARAYYVGIETAGLAIPGAPRPLRLLCVAPLGMEEGDQADVPSQEIGLVVGEPAQFRFFSSPIRKQDNVGDVLTSWSEEEVAETDSLEATLDRDEAVEEPYAPVNFQSRVTELGMFELWCVSTKSDRKWKLEFNVREQD